MENIKKTYVKYPYLEKPVLIYELENGHKIVFAYKNGALINISSWVKTGSINENDENNGISHFLEHLMFKGTHKYKAGESDRILESRGAIVNAATWKDYTYYYITVPKGADNNNFDTALELHSDMMLDPIIPPEEIGEPFDLNNKEIKIKRERHVVIEEIKMRKDKPWTTVYNNLNDNLYKKHPYKRDVIGNEQIISRIDRSVILDYYKKFYTPSNITTIIVGAFNPEDIIEKIIKAFDFKDRENTIPKEYEIEEQTDKEIYSEEYSKVNTGFLMFGYIGPKAVNIRDTVILEMICLILGQGQSSRLNQQLIEKKQNPIFNIINSDYYNFRDGSNFIIGANFKPEYKEEAIQQIKSELDRLNKVGIDDRELKKAKKKLKADFADNSETVSNIAETIGFYMTVCGRLEYVEEYIDIINTITKEEIKEAAAKYLKSNNAVISVLLPKSYKKD